MPKKGNEIDRTKADEDDESRVDGNTQVIRFNPELVQRLHDKVINVMRAYVPGEDLAKFQMLADEFAMTVQTLYSYVISKINEGHPRFSVTASTIVYDYQRLLHSVADLLYVLANKLIDYYRQKLRESIEKGNAEETVAYILRINTMPYAVAITMEMVLNALIGKLNINLPAGLTSKEFSQGVLGIDFNI